MTGLLSAISGQFSKTLLLSTLLPVTVFTLLVLVLVLPQVPADAALQQWIVSLDPEWQLAAVTLAMLLATAMMFNLNGIIIRWYEGYPWKDSWIGAWRSGVHRRRFASRRAQWHGLFIVMRNVDAKELEARPAAGRHFTALSHDLNVNFPAQELHVLPTTLGNVIRSFESYPERQYGMGAITLWPRLAGVLDEGFAAQLSDAKSALDFALNSAVLCNCLALLIAAVHLVYPIGLADERLTVVVAEVAGLLALGYAFYLAAIPRAAGWGSLVKAAFDLYRWKLLETLGYEPASRPREIDAERALWEKISRRVEFTDLSTAPLEPYRRSSVTTIAWSSYSEDPAPSLTRGVLAGADDTLTVKIRVRNPDDSEKLTDVQVRETLPDDWQLVWDSAVASGRALTVTGINPFTFGIGDLEPRQEVVIDYRMLPQKQASD